MIVSYEELDSTNRVAKELAADGTRTGTVVHAVSQSAGRGQRDRSFSSPLGGLYFSLILAPKLPPESLPLITLATGLACRTVLADDFHLTPLIKWPNDLYVQGKKLAGILCEAVWPLPPAPAAAQVVIGVGLNVNSRSEDFATDLQPIVTTLRECLQREIPLQPLLNRLVQAITEHVAWLGTNPETLLADWQRYDGLAGKQVVHVSENGTIHGMGQGIASDGRYCIHDDQGCVHRVIGGQIRPVAPMITI